MRYAIEQWTEIHLHGVKMRDMEIRTQLKRPIFIRHKTYENVYINLYVWKKNQYNIIQE